MGVVARGGGLGVGERAGVGVTGDGARNGGLRVVAGGGVETGAGFVGRGGKSRIRPWELHRRWDLTADSV